MGVLLKATSNDNAIVVTSTAKSEVKCDHAYFALDVEGREPTREACLDKQAEIVSQVRDALVRLGVDDSNARTGSVSLEAHYKTLYHERDTGDFVWFDPDRAFKVFDDEDLFDGYDYSFSVYFEMPYEGNSDEVERVWRGVSAFYEKGDVSIWFGIEDTTEADKRLRIKALEASRKEAESVAAALGMSIVRASHVDFDTQYEESYDYAKSGRYPYYDECCIKGISAEEAMRIRRGSRSERREMPVFNPKPLKLSETVRACWIME